MTTFPRDPIAAVTHPDPYPYYADLVAHRPLYFDENMEMWVASSAATVTAVLTSEICRVRPAAELVPDALRGTPAGTVFQHMVRFNDGAGHCPLKQAAVAALGAISPARVAATSVPLARALANEIGPERDPVRLSLSSPSACPSPSWRACSASPTTSSPRSRPGRLISRAASRRGAARRRSSRGASRRAGCWR